MKGSGYARRTFTDDVNTVALRNWSPVVCLYGFRPLVLMPPGGTKLASAAIGIQDKISVKAKDICITLTD